MSQADPLDDLLTKQDVQDHMHVSLTTVDRLIASGDLPAVRVGTGRGTLRVTRRALLEYQQRRSTENGGRP